MSPVIGISMASNGNQGSCSSNTHIPVLDRVLGISRLHQPTPTRIPCEAICSVLRVYLTRRLSLATVNNRVGNGGLAGGHV